MTKFVFFIGQTNGLANIASNLFGINETTGTSSGLGGQNGITAQREISVSKVFVTRVCCEGRNHVFIMLDLPLLEVGVDHTIGETLTANTDTFKYTVASQLMHDQVSINHT